MITELRLKQRNAVLRTVRLFFEERDYLETDTPIRLPVVAPERWIEPLGSGDHFLQTSPALCMKRLLSAGCSRIFQISPCFRKGERGRQHLSEFTMLEWYRTGIDYRELMDECEELVKSVVLECGRKSIFPELAERFSLDETFERMTVTDAFNSFADQSPEEALIAGCFDEVLVEKVEPNLGTSGRPVFLYDYPSRLASLARLKKDDPTVSERFELYVDGIELANGFSELADADEQRLRFEAERLTIKEAGRDPGPMPENFLAALNEMPEAAGIALGLDRLIMVLTGASSIDEVVCFVPEEL